MKKIVIIFLIVGGFYQFGLYDYFNQEGLYDGSGNAQTLMFTHKKCGKPCNDAKSLLSRRRIAFTEYKLDGNDENIKLWKQYGGVNSFPNMIIGNEKVYGSYKGLIISRLALAYGETVLTATERDYMAKHFYADGRPKLVMYGASWCPYCKKLRKGLNKNRVNFLEIDVEKSPRRDAMTKTMDIDGYPVVYYGYKRLVRSGLRDVMSVL